VRTPLDSILDPLLEAWKLTRKHYKRKSKLKR
jgi:hypothetical protein